MIIISSSYLRKNIILDMREFSLDVMGLSYLINGKIIDCKEMLKSFYYPLWGIIRGARADYVSTVLYFII